MAVERLASGSDDQSLLPLLDKTDLLTTQGTDIVCPDKLPVPLDEYGIPKRIALMRDVFGSLSVRHAWTGRYDLHHMAWPGNEYRKINDPDYQTGSMYRGASSLKVRMPRQLHNYVHAVTEVPPMPSQEVMRQYAIEHGQVYRLYDTIKVSSYEDIKHLRDLPFPEQETIRQTSYLQKIAQMKPGEIGVMPDLNVLSNLALDDARSLLRGIARANGISNARSSRQKFFLADRAA